MRIIAGKFKGKKLISPKTIDTRPTLDRVKESLFSILLPYTDSANVLDLFSGTGSLGIEAISRGAKFALLNDKLRISSKTILSNVKLTNCEKYVKISNRDYIECLNLIIAKNYTFDIIFLDPPYSTDFGNNTLNIISKNKWKILAQNGIIIYETDKNIGNKNEETNVEYENLECFDKRTYGRVLLKMYRWR